MSASSQNLSVSFHSGTFSVDTPGRGTRNVTSLVQEIVAQSRIDVGLCNVFIHHTSASLILCENSDPAVQRDLERFFGRLVPDGDAIYEHTDEGPDDMSAHIRSILTQSSLGIPIQGGRLGLGTWQGLYVWEHRTAPHRRKLTVSVVGF